VSIKGEVLSLKDLVSLLTARKNDVPLMIKSFCKTRWGGNLLTAHKGKGLEFETVFVLSCQVDIWAGRKNATEN
jgi:superfamily I DNA/RNA helicase